MKSQVHRSFLYRYVRSTKLFALTPESTHHQCLSPQALWPGSHHPSHSAVSWSSGSHDILEVLRLRALHGRELGFTEAAVPDLLGVSRETVSRWWTAYTSGGLDAI